MDAAAAEGWPPPSHLRITDARSTVSARGPQLRVDEQAASIRRMQREGSEGEPNRTDSRREAWPSTVRNQNALSFLANPISKQKAERHATSNKKQNAKCLVRDAVLGLPQPPHRTSNKDSTSRRFSLYTQNQPHNYSRPSRWPCRY
eukprot:2807281-Pleurochrysis_carterae.AAC.1